MRVECSVSGYLLQLTPEEERLLVICDNAVGHSSVVGGLETILYRELWRMRNVESNLTCDLSPSGKCKDRTCEECREMMKRSGSRD